MSRQPTVIPACAGNDVFIGQSMDTSFSGNGENVAVVESGKI
jgi:hypothetical protein